MDDVSVTGRIGEHPSVLLVDEREGYAWCASLSIRVVDWPEEKGGVVYRSLSEELEGTGSRGELPR